MITSLRGVVLRVGEKDLVVEVGGVGLAVAVTRSVLAAAPGVGEPIFLHTHLVVREDSLSLYGFSTMEERELFLLLLQVSGVGPRLALAVLSTLSPDELRGAIAGNQPEVLARVSGIGRKTAERILFHLRDRMEVLPEGRDLLSEGDVEVVGVLTALGYTLGEAQRALQAIPPDAPQDLETRVRLALQSFGHRS